MNFLNTAMQKKNIFMYVNEASKFYFCWIKKIVHGFLTLPTK